MVWHHYEKTKYICLTPGIAKHINISGISMRDASAHPQTALDVKRPAIHLQNSYNLCSPLSCLWEDTSWMALKISGVKM